MKFVWYQVFGESEGCLNSCCAVCIPGKNCDLCYQLHHTNPDHCPCLNDLTARQKQSILTFQSYFTDKFKPKEQTQESVWAKFIESRRGEKIFYWLTYFASKAILFSVKIWYLHIRINIAACTNILFDIFYNFNKNYVECSRLYSFV